MLRAFLSHSSLDKEYVIKVANHLTRSRVVFDKFDFEAGVDFRESIRTGLDNADLFVLFASRKSLESMWVNFELNEAELRIIEGTIKNYLVFSLDDQLSHHDLPVWLKRALIIRAPGAAQAARIIQDKLLTDTQRSHSLFVGREEEQRIFSERMGELGLGLPQVLVFTGLEGVGRRTFAKYTLSQHLSMQIGPFFNIKASEGLDDLFFQLLEEDTENLTKDQLSRIIDWFRRLSSKEQAAEVARQFSLFAKYNTTPVIIDQGAVLNDHGQYVSSYVDLIESLKNFPEVSLVIIQTRFPQLFGNSGQRQLVFPFKLNPLTTSSTARLLQHYLRNSNVTATADQIMEVASHLDGYPPAVIYASTYAREYGMDSLIADKSLLTDFKFHAFSEFLKKLKLSREQIDVLQVLAIVPPSSLQVLSVILAVSPSELVAMIRFLVDANVILAFEGKFTIATPVREAVWRSYGNLKPEKFSEIANRIKENLWDPENLPEISAIDILVFSLLRARRDQELEEFSGLLMPSTLYKAARAAYDNKEWKRARDLCRQVLMLNEERDDARVILFKSLVRENEESEEILAELQERHHKSANYLSGFRAWKSGDLREATKHYQRALHSGDESNPVYRELAECLYWLGDLEGAQKSISVVLQRRGAPNPFVLDLAAKIYIRLEQYPKAEEYIAVQSLVDRPENVAHRKATLNLAKGQLEDALSFANIACNRNPPLPETFLLRARIIIELGRPEAEKTLDEIPNSVRGVKTHILLGLKCKLLLKRGNWRDAEAVYERLHNKDMPENRGLRVQILRQKMQDPRINPMERQAVQGELNALEAMRTQDMFDNTFYFEPRLDEEE